MMKTARRGRAAAGAGPDRHQPRRSLAQSLGSVSAEQTSHSRDSYIITLDDITELVPAQRTSAWADVARRMAHGIEIPLTPIQLSAERIRRKFGKVVTEDRRF